MNGITYPLNNPAYVFFEGLASSSDVPDLLPVGLGGHAYKIDLKQFRRTTLDALRPAIDTASEPGQHSLNTAGVWSIIAAAWHHGMGQLTFDASDSIVSAFRTSKGIDPWAQRGHISMLKDTRLTLAGASVSVVRSVGSSLLVGDGTVVRISANPNAASPSFTDMDMQSWTGADTTVLDIASDGYRAFAALGSNGIAMRRLDLGASASQFSTYAATKVAYVNGRLLAAKHDEIAEIDSLGVATIIWTKFGSTGNGATGSVVSIVGTPKGIFFGYNTGDRGEVMFVGLNAATGALTVPVFAGSLNLGEDLVDLVYYQDLILATTTQGFRLGQIVQDRSISFGPVIPISGGAGAIAIWGRFAWFGINDFDSVSSGLMRVDLSKFTELLVPAYASDLMVLSSLGDIGSVTVVRGVPYFVVVNSGAYTEHATNVVATARINSGLMRLGSFDTKVAVGFTMRHEPLHGSIDVALVTENDEDATTSSNEIPSTATTIGTSDTALTLAPASNFGGAEVLGQALEVMLQFERDATDATIGPVLHNWTLRAMNISERTDEIILPIVMTTLVHAGLDEGTPVPYDTLDEYRYLKGLEASRAPTQLTMGRQVETVVIDKVQVEAKEWNDYNDWVQGIVTVRALTLYPVEEV